jgi:hypothetical protein
MRKLMLTAATLFLGSLAGCSSPGGGCGGGCGSGGCAGGAGGGGWLTHAHGVCDCVIEDHCSSRSPWIRNMTAAGPVEMVQPPAKLPDGKKDLE